MLHLLKFTSKYTVSSLITHGTVWDTVSIPYCFEWGTEWNSVEDATAGLNKSKLN